MILPANPTERLGQYFAGLTEHTFLTSLGLTDPPLIDYLSTMMLRFLKSDELYRLRHEEGSAIQSVPEMVREAELLPQEGATRREYLRHIGDFTLFWTGIFPEQIRRQSHGWSRDVFISYVAQGKRAYLIASQFNQEPYREESGVLRRLGESFEICAYGLNQVRKEFEHSTEVGFD
jgi:hypothetical protein